MRIIFIPGFGEDEYIFDKIQDKLPGEKLFLNLWQLLPNKHIKDLNVFGFAGELIERFTITCKDLIIGHSTGGWVAIHIKNIVCCPVVQIASWTDGKKVIVPTANRHLIFFAAKTGLYLNRFVMRKSVKKFYHGLPSKEVFEKVFNRTISGNRANLVNQLRLIFNPYPKQLSAIPDLRIHAKKDRVVRFPNEEAHEVSGDHFSLYTHPEQVYPPIRDIINLYANK